MYFFDVGPQGRESFKTRSIKLVSKGFLNGVDFAGRVAKKNGYTEPIGTHWMEALLRRNPEVKTLKGQKLDSERFNGASAKYPGLLQASGRTSSQGYQAREPIQCG